MRSVLLWRVLVVLVVTVLFASLFMMGGYMLLSREAYESILISELMPDEETIVQLRAERENGSLSENGYSRVISSLMHTYSALCFITDKDGEIIEMHVGSTSTRPDIANMQTIFDPYIARIVGGESINDASIRFESGFVAYGVGEPIYSGDGSIAGAIVFLRSSEDIESATWQLNMSLVIAVVVVFPLVFFISAMGLKKVTGPVHRIGAVAIEMSKGNFSVRANEDEAGEVGILARALNNLCDNLSQTIYQLRAEKGQLNQIMSSFTEGVAAVDRLGCLTHYNPALMELFGTVSAGTRLELVPDKSIWDQFDNVYESGEPTTMQYRMSGDRMLWITISPVTTEEGIRTGVVGLFKDMTEIERLEGMRREYVANVSHELRTPLTAVRGLLEPLADGLVKDDEDRQRYYRIMLREVLRLSRLITDMMELSRLQSGTGYMEVIEVDLHEMLEDIVQGYGSQAESKGIKLLLDAKSIPHVLTDPDRVEQVLIILLDNAMRYTKEGGSITISAENGSRVNVVVKDTGCGIPKEDIPYIFDRFYKVDKSRKEGGTGLGLSIAKFIMTKLGEKIIVESEVGKGTEFRFTLMKYVKNAIPLGPPSDERANLGVIDIYPMQHMQTVDSSAKPQDAPYEVIESEDKKEKERKERMARKKPEKGGKGEANRRG